MSRKSQRVKAIKKLYKHFYQKFLSGIRRQIIWFLRCTFTPQRRKRATNNAGFVLPTVAMVSIVIVLLTTAILLRSFDRAKNASNVRVNEAVLSAATPAIDRARAKINKLFQDGRLPRGTPTDDALYTTLTTNINEYTFGDETQLKLVEGTEESATAWMYPVDTDNNGKFDSYTLYGIYFKNPPISNGQYTRARNTLEARTPPMYKANWEIWYNPLMHTYHQIPASRLEKSYLLTLARGCGLCICHLRMINAKKWQKPLVFLRTSLGNLRRLLQHFLVYKSPWKNDLIFLFEMEFYWGSFLSPFYYAITNIKFPWVGKLVCLLFL